VIYQATGKLARKIYELNNYLSEQKITIDIRDNAVIINSDDVYVDIEDIIPELRTNIRRLT
jgi:hypothetical protein